jgi:hypothetical protein
MSAKDQPWRIKLRHLQCRQRLDLDRQDGGVMKNVTVLLASAGLLAGCATSRHLYPVAGPLAADARAPVYVFRAGRPSSSATVKTDQLYIGPGGFLKTMDPASYHSMKAEWDKVYGPGFYFANIRGDDFVMHYTLKGDRGGVMEVETTLETGYGIGVARDAQGNVFKLDY